MCAHNSLVSTTLCGVAPRATYDILQVAYTFLGRRFFLDSTLYSLRYSHYH